MTAPSLVLVADGSQDQRVAQTAHQMRKQLQMMRPALTVQLAFLDHCPPSGPQVVAALVARETTEVVFVPLELCRATEPSGQMVELLQRVRGAHPGLKASVARPIGPAPELLTILDERLRNSLRATRTAELDGLVLALPHTGDVRGNALVARRARQWSAHHKLPVTVAVGDGTGPGVAQAIGTLRAQGRRHIAVGAVYVSDCDDYVAVCELALAHAAVAVSQPIGVHDRLLDLAMGRYAYAAMDLLDDAETFESRAERDEDVAEALESVPAMVSLAN